MLVQTNTWHSAGSGHGAGSLMTFTGLVGDRARAAASASTTSRIYAYDPNLQFLPPPWFPAIDDTYTTTFFREVAP